VSRWARDEARLLQTATQYFSRIPLPQPADYSQERLDRSIRYFPLIGILVGGAMGLAFYLSAGLWPPSLSVALAICLGVVLTGGMHEDGLADFCDGFFASRDRDRVLAIMKDPRLGSYGVLSLVLTMLVRFSALVALAPAMIVAGLVAAHAFSRLIALLMMQSLDYVRNDAAVTKPAATSVGRFGMLIAAACGLLPLVLLGWPAARAVVAAAGVGVAMRWWCLRRIAGYTGDCLGATQQLTELAFYLGLLA